MDVIKMVLRESLSCETILRKAPDGHLIIISQCGGTNEPQKENREVILRSSDGGKSWSKPQKLYDDGRALYISEVYVYGSEIWAFALAHDGDFLGWETFLLKSADSGRSWRKCPSATCTHAFCFVRGGIRAGERILFPTQSYSVPKEEQDRLKAEGKLLLGAQIEGARNGTVYTEDGGKSFHRGKGEVVFPMTIGGNRLWKWTEPTIASLRDGTLVMLIRADGEGALYRSESKDGGESWSEFSRTEIPNPNNKCKLLNLPDGRIALIHTPNAGIGFQYRHPLCVWVSDDGLKTFSVKKQIVDFPGWLSYPDGIYDEEDGRIKFAFELNRHDVYFVDCSID